MANISEMALGHYRSLRVDEMAKARTGEPVRVINIVDDVFPRSVTPLSYSTLSDSPLLEVDLGSKMPPKKGTTEHGRIFSEQVLPANCKVFVMIGDMQSDAKVAQSIAKARKDNPDFTALGLVVNKWVNNSEWIDNTYYSNNWDEGLKTIEKAIATVTGDNKASIVVATDIDGTLISPTCILDEKGKELYYQIEFSRETAACAVFVATLDKDHPEFQEKLDEYRDRYLKVKQRKLVKECRDEDASCLAALYESFGVCTPEELDNVPQNLKSSYDIFKHFVTEMGERINNGLANIDGETKSRLMQIQQEIMNSFAANKPTVFPSYRKMINRMYRYLVNSGKLQINGSLLRTLDRITKKYDCHVYAITTAPVDVLIGDPEQMGVDILRTPLPQCGLKE